MKKRRGFTLVEAVVAMTLSLIILAVATSVILSTINLTTDLNMAQAAVREVDNILTCYRSADVESGLRLLYEDDTLTVPAPDPDSYAYSLYFDKTNTYIGTTPSEEAVWRIDCRVEARDTVDNGSAIDEYGITLTACTISEEEVLYEVLYTKAP